MQSAECGEVQGARPDGAPRSAAPPSCREAGDHKLDSCLQDAGAAGGDGQNRWPLEGGLSLAKLEQVAPGRDVPNTDIFALFLDPKKELYRLVEC